MVFADWGLGRKQTQGPEGHYPHQVQDGVDYGKESIEGQTEEIMAS